MYEDYDAMIRRKLEQQEMARCSRISRKYPGMSYEEIASSRSASLKRTEPTKTAEEVTSPDGKESVESVEPLKENDLKATGPDPFDKLNSKVGERPPGSSAGEKTYYHISFLHRLYIYIISLYNSSACSRSYAIARHQIYYILVGDEVF